MSGAAPAVPADSGPKASAYEPYPPRGWNSHPRGVIDLDHVTTFLKGFVTYVIGYKFSQDSYKVSSTSETALPAVMDFEVIGDRVKTTSTSTTQGLRAVVGSSTAGATIRSSQMRYFGAQPNMYQQAVMLNFGRMPMMSRPVKAGP